MLTSFRGDGLGISEVPLRFEEEARGVPLDRRRVWEGVATFFLPRPWLCYGAEVPMDPWLPPWLPWSNETDDGRIHSRWMDSLIFILWNARYRIRSTEHNFFPNSRVPSMLWKLPTSTFSSNSLIIGLYSMGSKDSSRWVMLNGMLAELKEMIKLYSWLSGKSFCVVTHYILITGSVPGVMSLTFSVYVSGR